MSWLNPKEDFPVFTHHPDLVFLDNAATTQKPAVVINAEKDLYEQNYANIHRALYDLAAQSTELYEGARQKVADFIAAGTAGEIIFTRNATEALNLVAWIEAAHLQAGDEILISVAEHHSNLLPWQRLACKKNLKLQWVELDAEQKFDLADFSKKLSAKTKLVAFAHVSNVLGDIRSLAKIISAAHQVGARIVIDAAQSANRLPLDVQALNIDYLAVSGHKMYGPTGVGFLYAKKELVADAESMILGGGTIKKVTRGAAIWTDSPWRFEAGTPPIAEVIALGATVDYLQKLGMTNIWQHEQELTRYALEKLGNVKGIRIYGPIAPPYEGGAAERSEDGVVNRGGIISFTLSSKNHTFHSHDVAQICNEHHVAIRGGHHCAQPLMESLGVEELNRISFGIYNNQKDIDRLVVALQGVIDTLK